MIRHQVVMYINEILVYSATLEDHIAHFRVVPRRLLENHYYVKADKCKFHQVEVSFLEYQSSAPLLRHPGPMLLFMVEVDASEVGVVTILSQRQGNPQKLF